MVLTIVEDLVATNANTLVVPMPVAIPHIVLERCDPFRMKSAIFPIELEQR